MNSREKFRLVPAATEGRMQAEGLRNPYESLINLFI
jgi:hypothetical protein